MSGSCVVRSVEKQDLRDFVPIDQFLENQINVRFAALRFIQRAIYAGLLPEAPIFHCHVLPIPTYTKVWDAAHSKKVPARTASPGSVMIGHYQTADGLPIVDSAGYLWVRRCRNAFYCPVCSMPRILKDRSDIDRVEEVVSHNHWNMSMITLTARHTVETKCKEFADSFQEAVRHLKERKAWRELKGGLIGTVSSIECTDDHPDVSVSKKSGFHWHQHVITVSEKAIGDDLGKRIKEAWVSACKKEGLSADVAHGCDISNAGHDRASMKNLSKYVSKLGSLGLEMSSFHTKEGRLKSRITMWGVLDLLTTGRYPSLYSRFSEYMLAVKGRSRLRFSRGLRDLCGIEEEEPIGESVIDYNFNDLKRREELDNLEEMADRYNWDLDELLEGKDEPSLYDFSYVVRHAYQSQLLKIANSSLSKGSSVFEDVRQAMMCLVEDLDPLTGESFSMQPPLIVTG